MSKEELYKKIGLLKRYEKYIQLIPLNVICFLILFTGGVILIVRFPSIWWVGGIVFGLCIAWVIMYVFIIKRAIKKIKIIKKELENVKISEGVNYE